MAESWTVLDAACMVKGPNENAGPVWSCRASGRINHEELFGSLMMAIALLKSDRLSAGEDGPDT
jgi:hypothetical protein